MPKLTTIVAGFALGAAVAGGTLAMGITAASASCGSGDCDSGTDGIANGDRGGTGGIAQDNLVGRNAFPVFAVPVENNNLNNNRNNLQQNQNNNDNNSLWGQQGFWNQGLFADRRNDTSGFGIVCKGVAIGFQDKTNRDNTFFNNNWWQNNNWWNNRDQRNNWWNNNENVR
ncbi:hypothetical protein F5972_29215 [Microbispora cellulosiformans]|uniref:Uncharacterized protein n=1 Tax=Microbispora cellulosiformans TaxID=2614688 RepID=A0A5J5JUX8_9ACTN|nr:hypothetical protein [Microbispora cellulosiformans]KAA9375043.1 hypothetical protein F5972_29215 [Microbispora cellulosiformans]